MADRDTGTQHKLRLPVELKEKIATSAKDHNRSMNADIVARIEQSFASSNIQSASTDALLAELTSRFDLLGVGFNLLKLNLDIDVNESRRHTINKID